MENKPPQQMAPAALIRALVALGDLLASRNLHFDIVVIGGGALALIGALKRTTKDLDVVATFEASTLRPVHELPPHSPRRPATSRACSTLAPTG